MNATEGAATSAPGAVTHAISREAARRMTYNQYVYADAERQRLTGEGQRRELTGEEVSRLRHAQAAVVGYLDYIFGPDPEVVYAKASTPLARHAVRQMGRAGRLGRLVNRR